MNTPAFMHRVDAESRPYHVEIFTLVPRGELLSVAELLDETSQTARDWLPDRCPDARARVLTEIQDAASAGYTQLYNRDYWAPGASAVEIRLQHYEGAQWCDPTWEPHARTLQGLREALKLASSLRLPERFAPTDVFRRLAKRNYVRLDCKVGPYWAVRD